MWHGHDHMLDDRCVLACRYLQDNNLTGTIPTEFGALNLRTLCASPLRLPSYHPSFPLTEEDGTERLALYNLVAGTELSRFLYFCLIL